MKRKTPGLWLLIWGLGLAGQLCWNMENQWFNTFVYAKIGKDPSIITGMLILSAAATTFATFFFGTWIDRSGKRRQFIGLGYILWGLFTIVFGLTQFISSAAYLVVAGSVVLADAVMSFFGSMGNDAGFSTWTNDIMTDDNRGQVGAALATQPVLGTMLGTVVGGLLVGSEDNYMRLFLVMGVLVILFGIAALLSRDGIRDLPPHTEGSFWQQFAGAFSFRRFIAIPELVLVDVSVAIFFIGFNTFFAYLGNYIIYYLGYDASQMGIIEAIPLVLSMFVAIPVGKLLNKNYHTYLGIASVLVLVLGLLILVPITPASVDTARIFSLPLWAGIFIVGLGYIGYLQTVKVWAKQLYPEDARGRFEGVWVLFFVLIPMIGGSLLGQAVVKTGGASFVNEVSGQMEYIPNGNIFVAGAIACALSVIPLLWTKRKGK